ncbi:MAG TPA: M36 family metallopeptidase, partial [Kofleriaceae bacterium]|nr:M36 family metallopeptidase [Kofleriaceae bacterium]
SMRVEPVRRTDLGHHLVRLVQEVDGIEIYRSEMKAVLKSDLSLVALTGTPSRVTTAKPADRAFRLTPGQAVSRALGDLYKVAVPDGFDSLSRPAAGRDAWVDLPALASVQLSQPARARKVFFRDGERLIAAYMTEFYSSRERSTSSDAYRYLISAADGRVLERRDLTAHEAFTYRAYARPGGKHTPTDGPQADYNPHPTGVPDGSQPAFVDGALITVETIKNEPAGAIDPWLRADATSTNGNNVDAYADITEPDGYNPGDRRATTTALRTFDYTYNHELDAAANITQHRAAVTSLFFTINWLHDYFYDSGFDEAAGNAQKLNYGRGGEPQDAMNAEAQDFGGLNNANMSTPSDGLPPRMQMYVFTGEETRTLELDPGDIFPVTGFAAFGPTDFDTTGEVVLAVDDTPPTSDACTALTNDVAGRIVLIDRGTCSFALKTLAAENAGAIGVIIANNTAGAPPPNMANTVPPTVVTIPTLSITFEAGNDLKTMLGAGTVTARLFRELGSTRSGAIDNMVVTHEWGHYFHHRLSNCGTFQCAALSEGWADFIALHNTLQGNDDRNGTYAMGIYAPVAFGDSAYFGIRRFPYSVDPTRNALSFRHIQNAETLPATPINPNGGPNSEVHNAGEVWASMLWEAYVALHNNPDGRNFQQVKRAFANYMVLGLQLAPVDATFTETRDAILAAIQLTRPSDLQVIADAFAVRGAGSCAVGPPASASGDLSPVVESFETRGAIDIVSVQVQETTNNCDGDGLLDGGEVGRVEIKVANKGPLPLTDTSVTVATATAGITFPQGDSRVIATLAPFATRTVRIPIRATSSVTTTTVLDLSVTVDNPAACVASVVDSSNVLIHLDEVPNASATETVEVRNPPWTEAGTLSGVWTRVAETPTDHAFHGADSGTTTDVQLVSPALDVSPGANLVVSFNHAHSFEFSGGINWDGGVIEISNDGGATWQDVSAFATPGYNGTITDTSGNPLGGRQGYVSTNPSFPATDLVTLDLGPGFSAQTVLIRFRIGTDASVGAPGWTIDDIAVTGIDNTPFGVVVDDDEVCTP